MLEAQAGFLEQDKYSLVVDDISTWGKRTGRLPALYVRAEEVYLEMDASSLAKIYTCVALIYTALPILLCCFIRASWFHTSNAAWAHVDNQGQIGYVIRSNVILTV